MTFLDGSAPDPVKESSDQTFAADVLEPSRQTPVIVDFWAPWCGPCRQLAPLIEKQVRATKGKVKLVKINIDENPRIAGQLGVQSIPAVFAFDKGRPVDGFMGLIPESQIKLFIDRLAGAGSGDDVAALLEAAKESIELGDLGGAAQAYAGILQTDPTHAKAIAGLARVYLKGGDAEQAKRIIEMAPPDKQNDADIAGVRAALELSGDSAAVNGDAARFLQRLSQDDNDHDARFELAGVLAAQGDLEGASEHLLTIIERDRAWNDDAARLQLLKVFEAAGLGSPLAKNGRRRLSALLFS